MLCVLVLSHRILNRFCMKLSVVVPVYNVEKFLPRCLDSLLRQGLYAGDFEVICVNDGSPDHSAAILQEYEARHPDVFKIVTQENQGLGSARNTGADMAQGEYVTFLDSDDYVIDNAYSYLLNHFCQDKPDVLCYNHSYINTDGKALFDSQARPNGEVTFDGDGVDAYNRWPLPFVWSKFYKRSFLEHYHIKSQIVISQDEIFNFDVFIHHPHTRIVSCNVCRYELGNTNSIQHIADKTIVIRQLRELFQNIDYMHRYIESGETEMAPAAIRDINNFLNVYHKKILLVSLSWKEWRFFREKMKGLPPFSPVSDSDTGSDWLGIFKKWAGCFYPFYVFLVFVRKYIFMRFLRPLIVKKTIGE